MKMERYLYLIITMFLVVCSDQLALDEVKGEYTNVTPTYEIKDLLEKAKWGMVRLISNWQIVTGMESV